MDVSCSGRKFYSRNVNLFARYAVPYRISGHETFACRYAWLPKAAHEICGNPQLFVDEKQAMVDLGVGKNMVRSIRFWSQAASVIRPLDKRRGFELTKLGAEVFGDRGLDRFLEDSCTLWLIHWNLSTNIENPLLAWDYLLNRPDPEIIPSLVIAELEKAAAKLDDKLSSATVKQHFEVFLHTYVPTRGRKGEVQEDNLDCPLVELDLLSKVGDREIDPASGGREPIYAFRRDPKPEITQELFSYCLHDFWTKRHTKEKTLPFSAVAHGHGSPGQVFQMSEDEVRSRLEDLADKKGAWLRYVESANLRQLRRDDWLNHINLLRQVYSLREAHA